MSNLPHCKSPCAQCPFRKDTLKGWLGEKRMAEILESRGFVCHKNTSLQCAGHMIIKGDENDFVQLANRMGISILLRGKDLIFDNEQELINHHKYK